MANFTLPGPLCTVLRLSGPLCTVLGRLEADAGTLSRSASPIPGPVGPQATPPPLAPTLPKESPAATAATPVVKLTETDFRMAGATLGPGVSVAIIRAFAEVESGGKSGFGPGGSRSSPTKGTPFASSPITPTTSNIRCFPTSTSPRPGRSGSSTTRTRKLHGRRSRRPWRSIAAPRFSPVHGECSR